MGFGSICLYRYHSDRSRGGGVKESAKILIPKKYTYYIIYKYNKGGIGYPLHPQTNIFGSNPSYLRI